MQLKTPEDASCSHIYVFPTSSFVQAAGTTFQNGDFTDYACTLSTREIY